MPKDTSSEMNDLGYMPKERGMDSVPTTTRPEDKPIYPTVTLCSEELPELEGATTEDTFEFHGIIEVVGVNEDEYTRGTEYRFHVLQGSVKPVQSPKDEADQEDVAGIKNAKKEKGDHMNKLMESDTEDQ